MKTREGLFALVVSLGLACGGNVGDTVAGDPDASGPPPEVQRPDAAPFEVVSLNVLTYNVAGLPEGISKSKPTVNTPQMSPLLNNYDLVLVQEDFSFHDSLANDAEHPNQSVPMELSLEQRLGDGLNRFSQYAFIGHERQEWEECSGLFGDANDCLTTKGFSVATHTIGGVEVDVYNLHMDAGRGDEDHDARAAQAEQMMARIVAFSGDRLLIIGGDTNMKDDEDEVIFANLLQKAKVIDACRALSCPEPALIDRILVRGNTTHEIVPTSWTIDTQFVDGDGEPLSDHDAIGVGLSIVQR